MNYRNLAVYSAVAGLVVLAVLGVYAYAKNPEMFNAVVKDYGYIGLFLAVFITNASLFVGIPTPTYIFLAVAAGLNPLLVTLVAAAASALGESTGYVLGAGSKALFEKKYGELMREWERYFHKHAFLTIVVIAALPFPPDDVAGVLAGGFGYDYRKFLLATFIGKFIKYGATALLTVTGIRIYNQVFYD